MQYSSDIYLGQLDFVETIIGASPLLKIFSGAVPANVAAADPSGLLATITLPADWMNAASGTTKTLLGTWSGTASGTGTPASFRIYTSGGIAKLQGSAGVGSGEMSFNGTFTTSQPVSVASFTMNAANT